VATPDRAPRSALHNQTPEGETQRADVTRAHARDSVADGSHDATKLTERNLRRLQERWGQPIEEPADEPLPGDLDEFDWRVILRGLTVHLHLVRDPLPSMRAVRADYKTGLEEAQQQSATAAASFRVFGNVGQWFGFLFRFLATCCDRPGRFAGLLFISALLAGSLAWAGLI
jgi:hypothetical protein